MFISLVCVQEVAELKEENLELSSDTTEDLSSDTATGSSILSESHVQYTHVHKLFNGIGVLLYIQVLLTCVR